MLFPPSLSVLFRADVSSAILSYCFSAVTQIHVAGYVAARMTHQAADVAWTFRRCGSTEFLRNFLVLLQDPCTPPLLRGHNTRFRRIGQNASGKEG